MRSLLRAWHSTSSLTWSSTLMPKLARSTNRLGLGGLVPAIAKKLCMGGLWGVGDFCLLLFTLVSLLEWGGGGAFFKALTAFDSCWRESWIFWRSRLGELSVLAWAGTSLWPISSLMIGWEMKVMRTGLTLANRISGSV